MEVWKLLVVIVTLFAFVCSAQGLSFRVDKEHWISNNWQDEPLEERLVKQVASLIKRAKAHQFYGLMGKRSEIPQLVRVDRRRNKGNTFVGLMGRRSLNGDTFSRIIPAERSTAIDTGEESDKQHDFQEEWDKLQYY